MLVRWGPDKEMMSLRQAMDRLMEEAFVGPHRLAELLGDSHKYPVLDVFETKEDIVVKASLPGVKPEDVDVSVADNVLTIKGEFKQEEEAKDKNYLRQERRYGSFSREFTLPVEVKSEKAEATFENGVLTLKLPRSETAKPKQIKIKAKAGAAVGGSKK